MSTTRYDAIEAANPGDTLAARLARGNAWLADSTMTAFERSLAKSTIIGWGDLCSDKDRAKFYSLASKFRR